MRQTADAGRAVDNGIPIKSWVLTWRLRGNSERQLPGTTTESRRRGSGERVFDSPDFIMNLFGVAGVAGFNLYSLLVAIVGAVVLLFLVGTMRRRLD
jgi:hypothetical protein